MTFLSPERIESLYVYKLAGLYSFQHGFLEETWKDNLSND